MVPESVKKVISSFLCRYRNVQDFFVAESSEISAPETDRDFFVIDNITDFENICKRYGFNVPDCDPLQRFENGDRFCLLAEGDHFGCRGWYCTDRPFYVLEIDRSDVIPADCIAMYHFFTNEKFRRQGFYCELLRLIVASSGKKYAFIYAYDTNPASSGAIKKAGFSFAGRFGHRNYPGLRKMLDDRSGITATD